MNYSAAELLSLRETDHYISRPRNKAHIIMDVNPNTTACGLSTAKLERNGYTREAEASRPLCNKCERTRDHYSQQFVEDAK